MLFKRLAAIYVPRVILLYRVSAASAAKTKSPPG